MVGFTNIPIQQIGSRLEQGRTHAPGVYRARGEIRVDVDGYYIPKRGMFILAKYKKLMIAVLEAAKNDSFSRKQVIRREALSWFTSKEEEWPFSFINICETLELDPDAMRKQILSLTSRPKNTRWREQPCGYHKKAK